MQSGWSVAVLMIAMGGLSVGGIGSQRPPTPAGWAIAGVLVVAGALLFLRRPFAFYLALAASVLLTLTGIVALAGQPQLALPVPPAMSIVVGLYLSLRLAMARAYYRPRAASPTTDEK